jgi:hemerythrin superfamily protein
MEDTGRRDLITVLTQDHREVERVFVAIENTAAAEARDRKDLTEQVTALLTGHAVAEAQYLYPTVRLHVPEGDRLIDREIRGHAGIELLLKSLDGMGPHEIDFGPALAQLMGTARAHFAEEEAMLFPKVVASCTQEQLAVLGAMVSAARTDF